MDIKRCDIANGKVIAPDGEYDLSHLLAVETVFTLKIKDDTFEVPLRIVYRNHCYSREYHQEKEGDLETWLLPIEHPDKQHRLFCKDRWAYSKSLPDLIQNIIKTGAILYRTTNNGLYYRIERSSRASAKTEEGIYLFFKFSKNSHGQGLVLSVESVHERDCRPANDRGRQSVKFWQAIREIVEKKHPHILEALKQQKAQ